MVRTLYLGSPLLLVHLVLFLNFPPVVSFATSFFIFSFELPLWVHFYVTGRFVASPTRWPDVVDVLRGPVAQSP